MIELEKTYLVACLPEGLEKMPYTELVDIYVPETDEHPRLRIRKKGEVLEITKKRPIDGDASRQEELTIPLNEDEYAELSQCSKKKVRKLRYEIEYEGKMGEIDVFQDELLGLVVADFEFESVEEKNAFQMPEFCLVDITHEDFVAGGMLSGKGYEDVKPFLEKFDYEPLYIKQ